MFTVQNIFVALALLLFVWYFVGQYTGRRRGAALVREIRTALDGVGKPLVIKWFGRSAFQIDVKEPEPPLKGLQVLCLLEPRDFALALAWNRLRGRRDQIFISANYVSPPPVQVRQPLGSYEVPGLTALETSNEPPHLRLTVQVGAGNEPTIRQAVEAVRRIGLRKRA